MLTSKKNLFADFGAGKSRPKNRLEELESQINQSFFKAAEALREIHDDKLYLVYAETFKEYCEQRLSRSVKAVYEQLKMLEIHKELQSKTCTSVQLSPLSEKDLSPVTGLLTSPQDRKYVKDLRKLARTPVAPKSPKKPKEIEMPDEEEDLLDEIITRIRRASRNKGFLKALKEWLDDRDI